MFLSDEEFSELMLMARGYITVKDDTENAEKTKRAKYVAAKKAY